MLNVVKFLNIYYIEIAQSLMNSESWLMLKDFDF